jgi:tetratricopeptide (TPR) repeat protein
MIPVSIPITETSMAIRSVVVKNLSVKQVMRALIFFIASAGASGVAAAQTSGEWFEKGLESFQWGKLDEAAVYFEKASALDNRRDDYFLYLGICYHRNGLFEGADQAYGKGIDLNGKERDRLLLNRGNLRASRGNVEGAASDYTRVAGGGGPLASSALLGRANLELNRSAFSNALNDYTEYLVREPLAPQRATIEELIGLLGARLASDAESARLAAEQARLDEERKLAEEALRAEEEARRAALMAEVLQSLSDSGADTSSISAGSENLKQDFEDSALED